MNAEAADLVYPLLAMLARAGSDLDAVIHILHARHAGHDTHAREI